MKEIDDMLADFLYAQKLPENYRKLMLSKASIMSFPKDKRILRMQEKADKLYFIVSGKVAVEVFTHKRGPITLQTLGKGEVIGWSWLIPPHCWRFDVRAIKETQTIEIDGVFLRQKCEEDDKLHCNLLQWVTSIMVQRLQVTRLQLIDIYGERL